MSWLEPIPLRFAQLFRARTCLASSFAMLLAAISVAVAEDGAKEAQQINKKVLELIGTAKYSEAAELANKGLSVCPRAGSVGVFCASGFNESLGDIASLQGRSGDALAFHERALHIRTDGLAPGHVLIARSQLKIGAIQNVLRHDDEAEAALKKAIAGAEQIKPYVPEFGTALRVLQRLYHRTRRYSEAAATGRRAISVYLAIEGPRSQVASVEKANLSTTLVDYGNEQSSQKDFAAAEKSFTEAISWLDSLSARPEINSARVTLKSSLIGLGKIRYVKHEYQQAEEFYLRAMKYTEPDDIDYPFLLTNTAHVYDAWDKPAQAIPYAQQAIKSFDERKLENPSLGFVLAVLARARLALGAPQDAEAPLARAIEILDRTLPESDLERIRPRLSLGDLQSAEGKVVEAERTYKTVLAMLPRANEEADLLRSLTLAALAMIYRDSLRYADARQALQEAIPLEEAAGTRVLKRLAMRLTQLGTVLRREYRFIEAARVLERAASIEQSDLDRAFTLNSLGLVYSEMAEHKKAEPLLKDALAIRQRELPESHPLVVEALGNVATIDRWNMREADAEQKLRLVLRLIHSRSPEPTSDTALYSTWLASVLISTGQFDEAETLAKQALEIDERILGPEHPRTAGALTTLASVERGRGRFREAEGHIRRALAIHEKVIGSETTAVATDSLDLYPLILYRGRWREAKATVDRALRILTLQFPENSPMLTAALMASARIAAGDGQYVQARKLADRVLRIQEENEEPNQPSITATRTYLAYLDLRDGDVQSAAMQMNAAYKIIEAKGLSDHVMNIDVLHGLGDVAWSNGDFGKAESYYRRAASIGERLWTPGHPTLAQSIDLIAASMSALGHFDALEKMRREQLEKIESATGPSSAATARAIRGLANVYAWTGRIPTAMSLYLRVLSIDAELYGEQSRETALDHLTMGQALRRSGQLDQARDEIVRARTQLEAHGGNLEMASCLIELAKVAFDLGLAAEGAIHLERALRALESELGEESRGLVSLLAQLGTIYILNVRASDAKAVVARIGNLVGDSPSEFRPGYLEAVKVYALAALALERNNVKAETLLRNALATAAKQQGSESIGVAEVEHNLALVYVFMGEYREAIKHYDHALAIYKRTTGDRAPVVGFIMLIAADAYERLGDGASANALRAAASEILGPTVDQQRPEQRWQ